jgi:hypothetical protein
MNPVIQAQSAAIASRTTILSQGNRRIGVGVSMAGVVMVRQRRVDSAAAILNTAGSALWGASYPRQGSMLPPIVTSSHTKPSSGLT